MYHSGFSSKIKGLEMIKIGDIFEIPLKERLKAYGQYIYKDKEQGPLIQVFDSIVEETTPFNISKIHTTKALFPPVITGLFAAVRTGLWRVVGNLPIEDFVYPKFVSAYYDEKTGEAYQWFIWDGQEYIRLGSILSNDHKNKEYLIGWSPHDIVYRIETGKYPYPYGDLIKHNKFRPRENKK